VKGRLLLALIVLVLLVGAHLVLAQQALARLALR
jgi:hypothetical protein